MNHWNARCLILLVGWGIIVGGHEASGACLVDTAADVPGGALVKKLSPACTQVERETHAVEAEAVLGALEKGGTVELVGVVVRGDLRFDRLPKQPGDSRQRLTADQQGQASPHESRLVRGALTISDSVVLGAVQHQSIHGLLQFDGPVDFHGTLFKEGVDLSRSVYQMPVDLSGAAFQKEAYFIQGQFEQTLSCKDTKFGPHTRFHRSVFHGPVDCAGALFDGMAEFLEVTFEQPALFDRARFGSGTGFSGSRFARRASFGEAVFSRDTFFTFSVFEEDAVFTGAQFLGGADFSDADFRKSDDLAAARFDQAPLFARAKRAVSVQPADGPNSVLGPHAVTVVCLLLAAGLVAYALKS